MIAIGVMGKFTLRAILVALGLGLGAMGGVSIALNAGLARWPGHVAEVRVALTEPTWLQDSSRAVPGGAAPRSTAAIVAAIEHADFLRRWADVMLRAQAEQQGDLLGLAEDRDTIAAALSSAILSGPLLIDGTVALGVGGFRSDAHARLAAATGGEALAGLINDLRREEILALREVTAQEEAQTRLGKALEMRDFGIAAATVHPGRMHPTPTLYLCATLGACIGLLLMLLALRPRAGIATQLHELATIARALGVEVIGAVPLTRSLVLRPGTNASPQLLDPQSDEATLEAFEVLLTNFRFAAPRNETRRVCFLSVVPGEGCSTVALNFAAAHARRGLRVGYVARQGQPLLVDPMLSNLFIVDNPAAPETGATQDLDLYVIAGPAVLADPDARGLAAKSDAVVLVMDTTVTGRELALRALGLLRTAQVPLAGLVLNRVRRGGLRRAFKARAEGRRSDLAAQG